MNYFILDIFIIIFIILSLCLRISSSGQREKNVALYVDVHEIGNNELNLHAIVDGDPSTCVEVNNGQGFKIQLNDTHAINKIIVEFEKGKGSSFSNTDEIFVFNKNEKHLCFIGQGGGSKTVIRCYAGQVYGDALEIKQKFRRNREWCAIRVIVCEDGFFGANCTKDCHCDGSEVCNKMSGSCPALCSPGWEGDDCQKACTNGTFGKNCIGMCHCAVGVDCDIRNGSCPGSRCSTGWYGLTCQTEMAKIKNVALYAESENSLDISWHSWGVVLDRELNLSFMVLYRRSSGVDDGDNDGSGGDGGRKKRKDGSENEISSSYTPIKENVIPEFLSKGWKMGAEVGHIAGRHNYIKTIDHLHHNTFYEFVVVPRLTLPGGEIVFGEASLRSQPFRTKCKAPGHPVIKNVTSYIDQSFSPFRAAINVYWVKLSDYESNCENILYYEIYYEDASKPMADRQWLKKTVHPTNEEVNITGVLFGVDYRVKMCVLNNYHLETCCDPIKIKTHEPPTPTFSQQSSGSATHSAGIVVGVLFLVLLLVVVVSLVFLQRQKYSKRKRFTESFFARNESQVGLATDLSHSSEHEDLSPQIVIHRSSLVPDSNHNFHSGSNSSNLNAKQMEKASNLHSHKTLAEMKKLSHLIPREELISFVETTRAENYRSLKREYEEIPSENPEGRKQVGQVPSNIMKNRFKDVIAYDHSRVILESEDEGMIQRDYINANYIDGYNRPKAYIATQGCKKNTLVDFWVMVWQQDARRIVMVTNLIERSSIKCHQYWPENVGSVCHYGSISVTLNDVIKTTHYAIRSFQVARDSIRRDIKQFHFTAWPDQGVPSKINQMLTFRNKVRSCDGTHPGIIVVHCSAGIGRTGAFIALDICMEQLEQESRLDVMRMTAMMRLQRCNLIQRVEQYIFVYVALAEYLKVGNTLVPCSKFHSYHQNLKKAIKCKGLKEGESNNGTLLHKQFKLLECLTREACPSMDEACSALHPCNKDKNRYSAVFPGDKLRPYLTSVIEGTNDYINAVYLDGYQSKNAYIITQMPLPSTVIDFWRLVFEHDVRIIVMLNSFHPVKHQNYGQYWPEENEESECGPFLIQSLKVETRKHICIRELELTCVSEVPMNSSLKSRYDSSPRRVVIFQMTSLDQDYFLSWSSKPMLNAPQLNDLITNVFQDLLQLTDLLNQEMSTFDVDLPIVVHCDDGQTLSGLFVAILCIYEKIKIENEVDIFQAVRNLKSSQKGIIPSLKHYEFLYEIASKIVDAMKHLP